MSTTPHTPPEPTTPTQTAHPWRAAVRTFVQTWVPFVLLIVLALPEVMPLLDDELGQYLPEHVRGWLLGIGTFAAALAALATRLMALQSVTRVLERFRALGWLAPTPPRLTDSGAALAPGAHRVDNRTGRAETLDPRD